LLDMWRETKLTEIDLGNLMEKLTEIHLGFVKELQLTGMYLESLTGSRRETQMVTLMGKT